MGLITEFLCYGQEVFSFSLGCYHSIELRSHSQPKCSRVGRKITEELMTTLKQMNCSASNVELLQQRVTILSAKQQETRYLLFHPQRLWCFFFRKCAKVPWRKIYSVIVLILLGFNVHPSVGFHFNLCIVRPKWACFLFIVGVSESRVFPMFDSNL